MKRLPSTAPYGSWPSPVDAEGVAEGEALLEWVGFVGREVWWTEVRPSQGGRNALMRHTPDGPVDALPGWDVRSRVIEYGGRPWAAAGEGVIFTHHGDQRVYYWQPGADPVPLSPDGGCVSLRYADFATHGAEVWCLRETVLDPQGTEVTRHLVALPLDGSAAADPSAVRVLAATHDFIAGPRIRPSGDQVAWLGWNHPAMPWDGTTLMVADIEPDGTLGRARSVLGGERESITEVDWSADGTLLALSDTSGWWNLYRVGVEGATALCPREEEFGEALWRIGLRWTLPLSDGCIAVIHGTSGRRLGVLTPDGELRDIDSPYTEWTYPATDGTRIAVVAAGPEHRRALVLIDLVDGSVEVLRSSVDRHDEYAAVPIHRTDVGPDHTQIHSHLYPPTSPDWTGPDGELPPYVVFVHGGPTSRSHRVRNQEITYFTSRGIGVVDVQYRGSTGFGRAYREGLRGQWGLVDVADCAAVARALIADGVAAADRVAIRGGSAGGWTAAASLTSEPDLYRAAAIYYPVLDLESWRAHGTHDFESRYLDNLVGPWPEHRAEYRDRSPVHHVDRIAAPFVLFQGLDDTICPPAQAERLLVGLAGSTLAHAYLTFDGEGHGFRRAGTIARCLRAELQLYGETLGFTPADTDPGPRPAGVQVAQEPTVPSRQIGMQSGGAVSGHSSSRAVKGLEQGRVDRVQQISFDRLAPEIKRKLRDLCVLDNVHGPLALLFEYALVAASIVVCVGVSYWFYPVAVLLIGTTHRFLAHLLHESSHKTFARNPVLNVIGGTILSGYLVFHLQGPYRTTHVGLHHRNLGDPDLDPDYRFHIECGLYDPSRSSRAFVLREMVLSVIGLRTLPYLGYLFRERFWSNSPLLKISTPVPLRIERVILVGQWALIIGVCAWFGVLPELLLFWFVPLCTANVAIGWLAEIAEHYPMPESESKRVLLTRNRHGRLWEQFLLSRHNDRFHLVHHLNTGLPFWNLRRAHDLLLADPGYALWDGLWAGMFSRPASRRGKETVLSYATKYRQWRQSGGTADASPSFAILMMMSTTAGDITSSTLDLSYPKAG